jgi:hypothetical protein
VIEQRKPGAGIFDMENAGAEFGFWRGQGGPGELKYCSDSTEGRI